jgi:hypothetical protein
MRRIIRLTLAVFIAGSLSVIALGQTAQFQGRVVDSQQRVVVGAEVRIFNQATGVERKVATNHDGLYSAPFVSPGSYQIYVEAPGFSTVSSTPLTVTVGQTVVFDVQLKVGAASEDVTVSAGSQTLNTTDASVSTVVDHAFVENLPLNGRSFQDLISLTPGVVSQSPQSSMSLGNAGDFSINGQRNTANYYQVDGVTGNTSAGDGNGTPQLGTTGSLGGTTALGTTQALISVDALQEFRVLSSSYSAEYGHGPGGQFSMVTRSGANNLHGSAYDYLRNNFFDANDWFNDHYTRPQTALRQNDFGGTLGGPVIIPHLYNGKEKSFFFASYEGMRLVVPQAASIQLVPDANARVTAAPALQGILNSFPLPTPGGVDYGTLAQFIEPYSLPSSIDSTSIRGDQVITPKLSLFFRYGDTPSLSATRSLSSVSDNRINTKTFTLGATAQISRSSTDELRIGYSRGNSGFFNYLDNYGGATPINLLQATGLSAYPNAEPLITLFLAGGETETYVANSSSRQRQWNVIDTISEPFGRHQMKAGVDFRHIKSPSAPTDPEVVAFYETPQSLVNNAANFMEIEKTLPSTPITNQLSLFAQDEWHVSNRVNLSLGLRWDLQPAPHGANGQDPFTLQGNIADPASLTVAPRGTSLWKTDWFNFAPRLGVAWQAHNQPGRETVVRAGGGVFFDSYGAASVGGFYGLGFTAYSLKFNAAFPLQPEQLAFEPSTTAPYTGTTIYAFPSHLQLPYTLEWNVSLQQALGKQQSFTLSYVASNGRRLLQEQQVILTGLNTNFPETSVDYFNSDVSSNFQSLQAQYQRTFARSLHALVSYTWSHSIDFGSTSINLPEQRGDSDFDVRQNLQAGARWDLPSIKENRYAGAVLNHWGVDGRLSVRGGFPVTLNGTTLTNAVNGSQYYSGLNLVPGKPIYLYSSSYPGGREINPAAFSAAASDNGDAPRNFLRGFGENQVNMAATRDFQFPERFVLQFRAETFNILNHPNFGYIDPTITDATFGQVTKMLNASLGSVNSLYAQGGPRSMQFALKLRF